MMVVMMIEDWRQDDVESMCVCCVKDAKQIVCMCMCWLKTLTRAPWRAARTPPHSTQKSEEARARVCVLLWF